MAHNIVSSLRSANIHSTAFKLNRKKGGDNMCFDCFLFDHIPRLFFKYGIVNLLSTTTVNSIPAFPQTICSWEPFLLYEHCSKIDAPQHQVAELMVNIIKVD